MPEVVTCPKCDRQLRVPDELVGQRVKCPTCGTNFTAAMPGQHAPPIPGTGAAESNSLEIPGDHYSNNEDIENRRIRALERLKPPAICLLVVYLIGVLCGGFGVVRILTAPPPKVEEIVAIFPALKGHEKELEEQLKVMSGPAAVTMSFVWVILALVTVFGSLAMLSGKMRWLALVGSVAAMINLGTCCGCGLGLPFGLWALIVLLNEEVTNAFR
jgi:predicted Zn finger-like uncharacterized protein